MKLLPTIPITKAYDVGWDGVLRCAYVQDMKAFIFYH